MAKHTGKLTQDQASLVSTILALDCRENREYPIVARYEMGDTSVIETELSAAGQQEPQAAHGFAIGRFAGLYIKVRLAPVLILNAALSDDEKSRVKNDVPGLQQRGCTKAIFHIDLGDGEVGCSFSPYDFEDVPPA